MQCINKGAHSICFADPPRISAWVSAAGKLEAAGPLGKGFDFILGDSYFGQKSWEQAEQALQQSVLRRLLRKSGLSASSLGAVISGDLNNQCIASSFCLRNSGIPHLGLYGACSTMAEAILVGAMAVGSGSLQTAAAMASSHFCTAERQYRFPLGYGGQRTPESQWTVTGAGAALITGAGHFPRITGCTLGTVTDYGITDPSNMGGAMAPSAFSTLKQHLEDFSRSEADYDLILTGDLGALGSALLRELCTKEGIRLGEKQQDCGLLIFDRETQDVGQGGSGAGCSAAVVCSWILHQLQVKALNRVLFLGTGALLSPLTSQQKLSIPGICHAVVLEAPE